MDELEQAKMDMPGVTDDEAAQVTEEKMRESMENDIAQIEKRIEQVKKEKANYKEQFEMDCELWDILQKPGNMTMLSPEFKFQEDPRYWELQEKKQGFTIRENKVIGEGKLKGYDMQQEELAERLVSAKEKLKLLGEKKDE